MSAALQKNIACFGFKVRWELERATIDATKNMVTEEKTVEGMSDVKWHLQWNSSDADMSRRLYLNVESENEITYKTHLHFFLQPDNSNAKCQNGTSIGNIKIQLEEVTYDHLLEDLLDGKLIIAVDGYFSYTNATSTLSMRDSAAEWGLRLKQSPKDFHVIVDGKNLGIHKVFVAAESPVFARMFESNFEEAKENIVTVLDFSFETVKNAFNWCYHQNIFPFLQDLDSAVNLLYFSDKYDFQTLKPILESHLSSAKFLTKENISILASTADKTNALQLRQACIKFICGCMLNKTDGFTAEVIATFDPKFVEDILFQALN
uniref:BTB domain-containing protein n=1 Tax=Panagrolaimus sp. ES5 TaxID=591445 RepID=A0AC34FW46_9BILA